MHASVVGRRLLVARQRVGHSISFWGTGDVRTKNCCRSSIRTTNTTTTTTTFTTRRNFAALTPGGGVGGGGAGSSKNDDNDDDNDNNAAVEIDRLTMTMTSRDEIRRLMGEPLQQPAGNLWGPDIFEEGDSDGDSYGVPTTHRTNSNSKMYIPEVSLYENEGRARKRILILCTGGTLTMAPDPSQGGSLAPVEGAISRYMNEMNELQSNPDMPDYVLHEYSPFRDSSDLGPADWATVAQDVSSMF